MIQSKNASQMVPTLPEDVFRHHVQPFLDTVDTINAIDLLAVTDQQRIDWAARLVQRFFQCHVPFVPMDSLIEMYGRNILSRRGIALLYGLYYPRNLVTFFHRDLYPWKKELFFRYNSDMQEKADALKALTRNDLFRAVRRMPLGTMAAIGW